MTLGQAARRRRWPPAFWCEPRILRGRSGPSVVNGVRIQEIPWRARGPFALARVRPTTGNATPASAASGRTRPVLHSERLTRGHEGQEPWRALLPTTPLKLWQDGPCGCGRSPIHRHFTLLPTTHKARRGILPQLRALAFLAARAPSWSGCHGRHGSGGGTELALDGGARGKSGRAS